MRKKEDRLLQSAGIKRNFRTNYTFYFILSINESSSAPFAPFLTPLQSIICGSQEWKIIQRASSQNLFITQMAAKVSLPLRPSEIDLNSHSTSYGKSSALPNISENTQGLFQWQFLLAPTTLSCKFLVSALYCRFSFI